MRRIFIAAFMLLVVAPLYGQYNINGKVLDENGQPLQGASVFILNPKTGKTTDKTGYFSFGDMKKTHYVAEVSYVGYEKIRQTLNAGSENEIRLSSEIQHVPEVTVVSVRATQKSAVTYSNVDSDEIAQRNLGQDIPYLLSLTPSFIPTSDAGTGIGYTGFRVRGADANRINITVNGVPVNDAESHGVFFVNMPDFASSLSSVQVQRGVGTSTNGAAAFGASINMQTQAQSPRNYAEISSSYGSFNTNKNTLKAGTGLIKNRFVFDVRLSGISSDGYIDRTSVDMKSYYFGGGYFGDKTTLKFTTFGGREKTYQAWNGVDASLLDTNRTYNDSGEFVDNDGNTQYYENQTDNYQQTHYHLNWNQKLNAKLDLNATLHYTLGEGYYEEYKRDRKYHEYGLTAPVVAGVKLSKTDLVRQKWLDNHFYGFIASLNYSVDKVNASVGGGVNRYDGGHFGKVIWVRNADKLDMSKEWYRNSSIKDDANIYAKANVELLRNLVAAVDLQYRYINYKMEGSDDKYDDVKQAMRDITQKHTFKFFNPKFGLTYKINPIGNLYASYSTANREPNRNNYTDAGPRDKPSHETLHNIELGCRITAHRLSGEFNTYYMKYKNQLILTGKVSEIGEPLTANIPDSYRMGVELAAAVQMTYWLNWKGNLALSRNKIERFTEYDIDVYDADWNLTGTTNNHLGTTDIAYSPEMVANSLFLFSLKSFGIGLHTSFVGKQYIDNTSDEMRSIPSYLVNNLQFKYSLPFMQNRTIDFQFMLNNLLNEKYVSNGYTWYSCSVGGKRYNELRYFPQAGRHFLLGITLKF
ncbi:MAG: TonB-dependent receptor [Prolixibacteraceae bacterium]|nr:TonB-dependent receptor [Prolixibacteraceae bacterium]